MFKSIRSRFTLIYFLLVFVAMILAGVFILQALEDYNLGVVSMRLDDISRLMLSEIKKLNTEDLSASKALIQEGIDRHIDIGLREEIYIIERQSHHIIASSAQAITADAGTTLDDSLVVEGLIGNVREKNIILSEGVQARDKVFPIASGKPGEVPIGTVYVRYDLNDIYASIDRARGIIVQASVTSLLVTIVISFLISKSITDPINAVTKKATLLADGNFEERVEVYSNDEIGALSKTFNFLSQELKRSISDITREKSKLETIIHYMEDGLVAVDSEGHILHSNPKAHAMLSALDTFDGDTISSLIPPYPMQGIETVALGSKIIKVYYAPIWEDGKNQAGRVYIFQDITEEKRLERMRKEFVANVSHELKTPITGIKSYAETLLDGDVQDPEMARAFLGVINSEADRMSRLVKDLLELSNFDSGGIRLNRMRVDILELVRTCMFKLKVAAAQKEQALHLHGVHDVLWAEVDSDRIEQLVLNILSNAIKYSPKGGNIDIAVGDSDRAEYFEIRVRDSGIGIPEPDLKRIFERFYRVDKGRSREMGGTGLGLSIAKEIVEAHGGHIGVESQVDVGTLVVMTLPRAPLNP